jgi:hypothetical protein
MLEYDRFAQWQPAARMQKLRIEQVATRKTWGRVPDTDMSKAALHVVHVIPAGSTTITMMNQLDPGLYGETVGEDSRPWFDAPSTYGYVAKHGKGMA